MAVRAVREAVLLLVSVAVLRRVAVTVLGVLGVLALAAQVAQVNALADALVVVVLVAQGPALAAAPVAKGEVWQLD